MEETKETINFGEHLMLDGYGGNPEKLNSRELVMKFLDDLPNQTGMTKIVEPVIKDFPGNDSKDPGGFSGFVMIAESHISVHTFPKRGFVSADVYTCQNGMDTDFIVQYFKDLYELKDVEVNFVKRGTRYPKENIA